MRKAVANFILGVLCLWQQQEEARREYDEFCFESLCFGALEKFAGILCFLESKFGSENDTGRPVALAAARKVMVYREI